MEVLPKNPLVKLNPNALQEVRKESGITSPDMLNESIDILQDWIKQQPYFNKKDFDRVFLEGFIIRAKGSVEKAKQRLELMCTGRTLIPKLYEVSKISDMTNIHTTCEFILPKQTADHCTIYFGKNREKEFGESYAVDYYKRMNIIFQFLMKYDYSNGIIVIVDLREADLNKNAMDGLNPAIRKLVLHTLNFSMKSFGARLRSTHYITDSKAAEKLLAIAKPVLKKVERVYMHSDLESLYKHVDKDLLPADYGGKEETSDVLYERSVQFLSSDEMLKNMEELSNATIDTKLKQVCDVTDIDLGVSGTFRKLNVD